MHIVGLLAAYIVRVRYDGEVLLLSGEDPSGELKSRTNSSELLVKEYGPKPGHCKRLSYN
jgi:hypothetical protein